jgi:hypothetical protein
MNGIAAAGRGSGGGVILSTTSEAMLVSSRGAALHRAVSVGVARITRLTVYLTVMHSTFSKACRLAGFDLANIRSIPTRPTSILTDPETDCALDLAKLHEVMQANVDAGLVPTYVCATVDTTSFNAWVHIDAAYASSACVCPEFQHHLDGVERVDSISMSPHKWLMTCLDCTRTSRGQRRAARGDHNDQRAGHQRGCGEASWALPWGAATGGRQRQAARGDSSDRRAAASPKQGQRQAASGARSGCTILGNKARCLGHAMLLLVRRASPVGRPGTALLTEVTEMAVREM